MKNLATFISLILYLSLFSQEIEMNTTSSSGGYFIGGDININFTLGESVINTISNNEYLLTQGFNQPSIKIINSIDFLDSKVTNIILYPNPSIGNLKIIVESEFIDSGKIKIVDLKGKFLLAEDFMTNNPKELNVGFLSSGFYFLSVYDNANNFISTHKLEIIN